MAADIESRIALTIYLYHVESEKKKKAVHPRSLDKLCEHDQECSTFVKTHMKELK